MNLYKYLLLYTYSSHFKSNANDFFTDNLFLWDCVFTVLLYSLPASQWLSPPFGKHCYSIQDTTFIHVSNSSGTVGRTSSTEEKRRPWILLTLRISRSLVDSCLDCRANEVTLPTHNREVFLVTTSAMCGRPLSWRMNGPAKSNRGRFLCIFLRIFCMKTQ